MQMSFTLQLPRDAISVSVMRGVLTASLRSVKVDEECVGDIAVALTEACTNVLAHSQDGDQYEVVARIANAQCQIEVVDNGRGFDPERLGHTEAEMSAESGRGIQLMRALVDHVDFGSAPERGFIVRLFKDLKLPPDSPLLVLNDVRDPALRTATI